MTLDQHEADLLGAGAVYAAAHSAGLQPVVVLDGEGFIANRMIVDLGFPHRYVITVQRVPIDEDGNEESPENPPSTTSHNPDRSRP